MERAKKRKEKKGKEKKEKKRKERKRKERKEKKRKEWADDEEALYDIHDDKSEHASWNISASNKLEHLIIGDSIVQNISSDKFHKCQKTKIITQRGRGIDKCHRLSPSTRIRSQESNYSHRVK